MKMLYSLDVDTTATRYGRTHESIALEELSEKYGLDISRCGLFIDREYPFLAATPDGLVNDGEGIVEVKCPAAGAQRSPDEVIDLKLGVVGSMFSKAADNTVTIKKMHNYHLQVQGQLHITRRSYCLFVIWTPKGIRVETILKDDELWEKVIRPRVETFYMTCLLPELIDPRHKRSMPIREPQHIMTAITDKERRNVAIKRKIMSEEEHL